MSDQVLLLVGVICFSLMLTGLALTSIEFKRRLKRAERKRNRKRQHNR